MSESSFQIGNRTLRAIPNMSFGQRNKQYTTIQRDRKLSSTQDLGKPLAELRDVLICPYIYYRIFLDVRSPLNFYTCTSVRNLAVNTL